MQVVTAAEMRHIDRRTIETYRVPGIVLMENAGLQLLHFMQEVVPQHLQGRVIIVAGPGNNGGDGLILARHLWQRGKDVQVFLLADAGALRGDARRAYQMARTYKVPMIRCTSSQTWQRLQRQLAQTDLIVDAMLGTGLSKPVAGLYAEVIQAVNSVQKPILAVDIPSGLAADHGKILGEHIRATYTVTFALPKRSLLLYPAATAVGTLHVANIGIPPQAITAEEIKVTLLTPPAIRAMLPTRRPESHKGSHGHVLVVAGSLGKSGAGALASEAALRTGAGLVTLALPASLNMAMETRLTEVMTLPVAEVTGGGLAAAAAETLGQFLSRCDALVLGPGLGTHQETVACVHALLRSTPVPVVVDADGLNALVPQVEMLRDCASPVILTPHPGEMARLAGSDIATVQAQRLEVAQEFARRLQVYLVLKGAYSVIAAPDGRCWINPTGNAAMATAGTGDVLAGVIGALLSQGLSPLHAALGGVYLHGTAGDRVQDKLGGHGLLASDLVTELPYALAAIRRGEVCCQL